MFYRKISDILFYIILLFKFALFSRFHYLQDNFGIIWDK